jgi:hypothetical protein
MPSYLHKLTLTAIAGAVALLATGCQMPSFARNEPSELESAPRRVAELPPRPKALASETKPFKQATFDSEVAAASDMTSASDMAAAGDMVAAGDSATHARVMKEVQQISAEDPEAGQILLEELSRSQPKLWPLTVQQFRSRQAYHDRLLSRPKRVTESKPTEPTDVVSTDPPSEEFGSLTDPRGIRSDPRLEQAFARATPANMPAPVDSKAPETKLVAHTTPAAFAEDSAAAPLPVAAPLPAQHEVVQASAVSAIANDATNESGVEQALYNSGPTPSNQEIKRDEIKRDEIKRDEVKRDWQTHLKLAIEDLDQRLVDGPRSTAEMHQLVSLRVMELLAGNTEAALKPIPNVSTEEQDFWSSQLFALATFLDHHRQPEDDRRAAASVVHLDEAVGHLRELGTLSLRNLAFCKNVYGYGAYEPITSPSFTPGQQVTLYLEVENYHSESTPKGYATKLGASYELVNEAGERVAGGDFPAVEDCCQSRRRDFHIQYGMVLPKTAKPGKHHLKLAMKDRQSDKMGTTSITFEIR